MEVHVMIKGILLALIFSSYANASTKDLQAITQTKINGKLKYIAEHSKAVGIIKYRAGTSEATQSGFFVRPHVFLTTLAPRLGNTTINCSYVRIMMGSEITGQPKTTYNCKKIVEQDPKNGYMIIEINGTHDHTIPIISKEDQFRIKDEPVFSGLGFHQSQQLFLTNHCSAKFKCKACNQVGAGASWTQADCLYTPQMVGGPIISRAPEQKNKVVGMIGYLTTPAQSDIITPVSFIVKMENLLQVSDYLNYLNSPPPTCTLAANPKEIENGDKATLTITMNGFFTGKMIDGVVLPKGQNSLVVEPNKTKTFSATVFGPGGATKCSAEIKVKYVPPPSCSISATPPVIKAGESTKLSVKHSGKLKGVEIYDEQDRLLSSSATYTAKPLKDAIYTAKVFGPGGHTYCETKVKVKAATPPVCSISPSPRTINRGGSSTLTVAVKGAYKFVSLYDDNGKRYSLVRMKSVVKPAKTMRYEAQVTGIGGSTYCEATVKVKAP